MNGQNEPNTFLVRFEQSIGGLETRVRTLEDKQARSETNFTNREEKCREHARQLTELYDTRNAVNLKLQGIEMRLVAVEKRTEDVVKSAEGVGKLQDNVEGIKTEKKEARERFFTLKVMIYTGLFGILCSILTAVATYYIMGR